MLQTSIEDAHIFVPAIWRLEVANFLVIAERRGRYTPGESAEFLARLSDLSIVTDTVGLDHAFTNTLDLARRYQRSAYDACYLELTLRLGLPLATRDEPLQQAAESLGIPIYTA